MSHFHSIANKLKHYRYTQTQSKSSKKASKTSNSTQHSTQVIAVFCGCVALLLYCTINNYELFFFIEDGQKKLRLKPAVNLLHTSYPTQTQINKERRKLNIVKVSLR